MPDYFEDQDTSQAMEKNRHSKRQRNKDHIISITWWPNTRKANKTPYQKMVDKTENIIFLCKIKRLTSLIGTDC